MKAARTISGFIAGSKVQVGWVTALTFLTWAAFALLLPQAPKLDVAETTLVATVWTVLVTGIGWAYRTLMRRRSVADETP